MSLLSRIFGSSDPPDVPEAPQPDLVLPTSPDDEVWYISDAGLRFIMRNESLETKAYRDSAGVPTIGYGTIQIDGVPVKMGDTITPERAMECLRKDSHRFTAALQRLVTVKLNQNQIDAVTDFMYNVGGSAFASSSLLKVINAKQRVVVDLFTRWNKIHDPKTHQLVAVAGLTARRNREFTLYTS